jgi:hypothetical protein
MAQSTLLPLDLGLDHLVTQVNFKFPKFQYLIWYRRLKVLQTRQRAGMLHRMIFRWMLQSRRSE